MFIGLGVCPVTVDSLGEECLSPGGEALKLVVKPGTLRKSGRAGKESDARGAATADGFHILNYSDGRDRRHEQIHARNSASSFLHPARSRAGVNSDARAAHARLSAA